MEEIRFARRTKNITRDRIVQTPKIPIMMRVGVQLSPSPMGLFNRIKMTSAPTMVAARKHHFITL